MTLASPRSKATDLAVPPVVAWPIWRRRFLRQWKQGDHVLDVGPTQSGKSLLAREIVLSRKFTVIFGTKPKDETLDDYISLGFTRIDHWPPTPSELRKARDAGRYWFILWPKIREVGDLHKFRPLFAKCLDSIFVDGGWTAVVDETLWFCDREGLNLAGKLGTMAYGSASNKITFLFLMQRPSGVPRILWSSCSTALIFHIGGTNDVRELASLGTEDPKAAVLAIRKLKGHSFLDLPLRGGAPWSISEVEI
jgi:hypothetical protein